MAAAPARRKETCLEFLQLLEFSSSLPGLCLACHGFSEQCAQWDPVRQLATRTGREAIHKASLSSFLPSLKWLPTFPVPLLSLKHLSSRGKGGGRYHSIAFASSQQYLKGLIPAGNLGRFISEKVFLTMSNECFPSDWNTLFKVLLLMKCFRKISATKKTLLLKG